MGKLTLTVYSSSPRRRFLGALLILAGIALFLLVTVFLKQNSLRLAAQLPAARLRESLQELQTAAKDVVSATGAQLPVLLGNGKQAHSLQSLIDLLSDAKLDSLFAGPLVQQSFLATQRRHGLPAVSERNRNAAAE